jgi:hypothetical protein
MDAWMRFALAVLAVWRITHLLVKEDGPWDLIVRLRKAVGGGLFGRLMDCFQCLTLWVAAPFTFFLTQNVLQWVVGWLAISGAACLLERAVGEPEWMVPGALHSQEGGTQDGLLRPKAGSGEPAAGRTAEDN